eukprot:gene9139-1438_t
MDNIIDAARTGVVAGATWGAITAAWEAKPIAGQQTGALVFSTARTIATNAGKLGLVAAVFASAKEVSEGVRGTDDPVNSFIGGCAAGSLAGFKSGKAGLGVGACLGVGAVAAIAATGNRHTDTEQAVCKFFILCINIDTAYFRE